MVGLLTLCALGAAVLSSRHVSHGARPVASPLVGAPAPPLSGDTVTGGHVSLSQYRGRWVVLNFFASWCVPCEQETPVLARFAHAHPGPRGPAVVGVVYQDDDGSVKAFSVSHGATWPLLAYRSAGASEAYGVSYIPVTFLIAPDGRVAAKLLGGLRPGQLDTVLAGTQAPVTPASASS